jgi:fructokinase
VNADNVSIFPESKSPLSLAFLDENNNADYIFYKDHPHDQLEVATPEINPGDIVLFGSFFALNPVVRPQVAGFLEYAKEHGAILYYDINFRASHQNEIMKITPNLIENLEMADFVRGSHEDFGILYKKPEADKVYNAEISFYCKKFICTQGAEPVEVRAENGFAKSYPSEKMKPVSTIGAGDNFNAGFVFGLIKDGITREDIDRGLSEAQWDSLLVSAQEFSTECCKDIYNYVSKEFGEEKKKEL